MVSFQKTFQLASIVFAFLLLAACGSPDPVVVISSNPSDGEKPVARNTGIELNLSGALDAASILPENVLLTPSIMDIPVPVTLVWDELTLTLLVTPSRPLRYGTEYTLSFPGILDSSGGAVVSTLSFSTYVNEEMESVFFNAGAITRYEKKVKLGNGDTRKTTFILPGTDNTWFTTDDPIDFYTEDRLDATGKTYRTIQAGSAGTDGIWGNGDDVLDGYADYTWNAEGKHITGIYYYNNKGPDGWWFTADDDMVQYVIFAYDSRGLNTQTITFTGAGPDETWVTSDDTVALVQTSRYNAAGLKTHKISYSPAGGDGLAGTADDGQGADNRWFTADDIPYETILSSYDAVGARVDNLMFRASGVDLTPGTGDDGFGPDGTWLTADDIPFQYTRWITISTIVTGWEILGVGIDLTAYTADDTQRWRGETPLDANSNRISQVSYTSGADVTFYTGDDMKTKENTYNTTE